MLDNALSYLRQKLKNYTPDTLIILGSGLGGLIEALNSPIKIDYADIPDFPQTSVAGHKGCLYCGNIGNHCVLAMQGRFHLYEGIAPQIISDVMTLFQKIGIKQLIVTNASGSLYKGMPAGSLMMITDHINMSGQNPLIGPHDEPYFLDMSNAYDKVMCQQFKEIAVSENVKLFEGVYIMTMGPNYETPSEVKMFRLFGADAVGMSTVPEVISAVHKGIKVLGISVISNLGTGLSDEVQNHEDVLSQVGKSAQTLGILIQKYLEKY